MCGIVGVLGTVDSELLQRMLKSIHYRGPDDEGMYISQNEKVMLGHRRLSIIDLSHAGHQPMSYEDGKYWVTYNGEIYNYLDIKKELISLGKRFNTDSDTEVILAAYSQWGKSMVKRLRGMFAFAIWDVNEKKLFAVRDRFGIKPFYYSQHLKCFVFASELKAVIASNLIPSTVNLSAIVDYLQYGSITQPQTIYSEIHALEPGHFLELLDGKIKITKYWDLSVETQSLCVDYNNISKQEAVDLVRNKFIEATRYHLIADVPIGAFLSGGMDSTAVVAFMSHITQHTIKTFSVGYEGWGNDRNELPWAKKVAKYYNTDHTEIIVTPHEAIGYFHSMMDVADQPSVDGLNTYIVSKSARKGVTVSISGLGGDELFGGYPHFHRIMNAEKYLPSGNSSLLHLMKSIGGIVPFNARMYLQTLAMSERERVLSLRRLADSSMSKLLSKDFILQVNPEQNVNRRYEQLWLRSRDVFQAISYFECTTYLRNTLLRDADQMSMVHSLEVRPVLLDHELAETVFAIPSRHKYKNGVLKHIFVEAIKGVVPPFVTERRKMGFELPLIDWLNSELNADALRVFNSPSSRKIFSNHYIQDTLSQLKQRNVIDFRAWAYYVLLTFLEKTSVLN